MHLLFFVHDLADNPLGRAWSLGLLAEELGWDYRVLGPAGGGLWEPIQGTAFAQRCIPVRGIDDPRLQRAAAAADVVVAIKAWPRSLGWAETIAARTRLPLIADVDDPDWNALFGEYATMSQRLRATARMAIRRESPLEFRRLQSRLSSLPVIVSNPELQRLHGGTLIPHVRPSTSASPPGEAKEFTIGFVGTPRRHKGVNVLRSAVASRANVGVRLVITAPPPRNARPWESWVGVRPIETIDALLRSCTALAIPSLPVNYGPAQLPVKTIDAMLAARPVIASDIPPLRWALGAAGILVAPGSSDEIGQAIDQLRVAGEASRRGAALHERAMAMFTPAVVAPSFRTAIHSALGNT